MPRPSHLLLAFALAAVSASAAAQRAPSGEAVLAAWQRGQTAALRGVTSVELDERSERSARGPRGETRVETEARVVYRPGERPERRVVGVRIDGRDVPTHHLSRLDERLGRAYGPPGVRLAAPAALPADALAEASTEGAAVADRIGGVRVWRVALRLPPPHARHGDGPGTPPPALVTAWFSRDADPRLVRLRAASEGPRGAVERTVDAERTDGLDVPVRVDARADIRQTRRLRDYTTTVRVVAVYGRPTLRR